MAAVVWLAAAAAAAAAEAEVGGTPRLWGDPPGGDTFAALT